VKYCTHQGGCRPEGDADHHPDHLRFGKRTSARAISFTPNCFLSKPVQLEAFENLVQSINDFWLTNVAASPAPRHRVKRHGGGAVRRNAPRRRSMVSGPRRLHRSTDALRARPSRWVGFRAESVAPIDREGRATGGWRRFSGLTESVLMRHVDSAAVTLRELRARRVVESAKSSRGDRCLGTGYSSLSYVGRFPLDARSPSLKMSIAPSAS
jgi:hypothetical protein